MHVQHPVGDPPRADHADDRRRIHADVAQPMAQRLTDPRLTEAPQIGHRIWPRRAMISQIQLGDMDQQRITTCSEQLCTFGAW
jgi:hypothetical protein